MTELIKRTHFLRLRDGFNAAGVDSGHSLREIRPTPTRIVERVSRIPWNWINKRIYDAHILPGRIAWQKLRLFDLLDDGRAVGYSIAVSPDADIRERFLSAVEHLNPVEIENIALYPGQEGHGRGLSFLKLVESELHRSGHGVVYLNTSETNFPTLPKFYRRAGMIDLGQDQVPDFNKRQRAPAVA